MRTKCYLSQKKKKKVKHLYVLDSRRGFIKSSHFNSGERKPYFLGFISLFNLQCDTCCRWGLQWFRVFISVFNLRWIVDYYNSYEKLHSPHFTNGGKWDGGTCWCHMLKQGRRDRRTRKWGLPSHSVAYWNQCLAFGDNCHPARKLQPKYHEATYLLIKTLGL